MIKLSLVGREATQKSEIGINDWDWTLPRKSINMKYEEKKYITKKIVHHYKFLYFTTVNMQIKTCSQKKGEW